MRLSLVLNTIQDQQPDGILLDSLRDQNHDEENLCGCEHLTFREQVQPEARNLNLTSARCST